MYGPSDGDHVFQDDLPNIYFWVFANRGNFSPIAQHLYGTATDAAVNIPSIIPSSPSNPASGPGMNMAYWEWDTTLTDPGGKPAHMYLAPGQRYPVQTGLAAGSYPWEDQTHHFAAYFYLGAAHGGWDGSQVMGNTEPPIFNLVNALDHSGDYPGPVGPKPAAVPKNEGDYFLGIVAADLGTEYRFDPGKMGATIEERLQLPYVMARSAAGRTSDP